MEDGLPPEPKEDGIALSRAKEEDRRDLRAQLKETERLWDREGDSEALWERTHDLLIRLQRAGDIHSILKRTRRSKRAVGGRGTPRDLAQASLALWVMERFGEAEAVLRVAVERLPTNRYPWSLLLRELSWDRDPGEAMAFIVASLDRVPWRGHALVQLGTLLVDSASKDLSGLDLASCRDHLEQARAHLELVPSAPDASDALRATAGRLLVLVETLEHRCDLGIESIGAIAPEAVRAKEGIPTLEASMRKVAEASGVRLEGERDEDLDLDELERAAHMEMPEDEKEERYTVLEVTPKEGVDLMRRRRREG